MRNADPAASLDESDIECVFYGDLFRPAGRFLSEEVPPLTAEDVDDDLELELLLSWWREAAARDPAVVAPDARTLGVRSSARAAILALAGARILARVSERVLVWWVKQVTTYFTQPEVRAAIRKRFLNAIGDDTRVVVAHSLGSVVAYEVMCSLADSKVTDLVTLGSPLGVPHVVLHRLDPAPIWPPGVRRWTNITDDADFVALQPRLRKIFGPGVTDVAISNGFAAHQATRYLTAAETGSAIIAGLSS
ncbi:hypothetical protein [Dactylosporangium cerinum]